MTHCWTNEIVCHIQVESFRHFLELPSPCSFRFRKPDINISNQDTKLSVSRIIYCLLIQIENLTIIVDAPTAQCDRMLIDYYDE